MIIGCHEEIDRLCTAHREDEHQAANDAIVRAAYGCGVFQAFCDAVPEDDHEVVRRAFMTSWYLAQYVAPREHGQRRSLHDPLLDQLDLEPLRAAVAEQQRVVRDINTERRSLLLVDHEGLERSFAVAPPDTPAFRSLAAATAVRWPDGTPRCLFHANTSGAEFSGFKPITHFGAAMAASRHASKGFSYGREMMPVVVHAVWLDIRRPLRVTDLGGMTSRWLVKAACEAGVFSEAEARAFPGAEAIVVGAEADNLAALARLEAELARRLLANGYDGIVYANAVEGGGDSWIILRPDQAIVGATWRYEPTPDGLDLTLVDGPSATPSAVPTPPR